MAITNTPFVDGNAITESDLKGRLNNFETWLNGGSANSDLSHGEWVKAEHIFSPNFVPGSDDRAEFCTGTTRWRNHPYDKVGAEVFHSEARGGGSNSNANNWEVVNGLNVSLKVYRPVNVVYLANWWAWESGTTGNFRDSSGNEDYQNIMRPTFVCAHFMLYSQKIDGSSSSLTRYTGTRRSLYTSLNGTNDALNSNYKIWLKAGAKQFSIAHVFSLTEGVYNIGVRCHAKTPSGYKHGEKANNIFVRSRQCVVDAYFNSAT